MIRALIRGLADSPVVFDILRWILEGGYDKHRRLIADNLTDREQLVLDCGCGTGIYASCFEPAKYLGIDISPNYIARCRQRCSNHEFRVMDATRLELADGGFGAAIISGVLHHLDDNLAHQVCSEVKRILEPGGKLLVWEDIPTRNSWNWVGATIHRLDLGEHIRTPSGYEAILRSHFTVASTKLLRSGFMDYAAICCTKSSHDQVATAMGQAVADSPTHGDPAVGSGITRACSS